MNRERLATIEYLKKQLELGLKPQWVITYHYYTPDEIKPNQKKSVWKTIPYYNYISKRRNDYDKIIEDNAHIKNVLLRDLFNINRPQEYWKYEFPNMIFFHEKGVNKLKYHTHLVLPDCKKYNDDQQLTLYMNSQLKMKVKCLSHYKIDITKIDNPIGILKYLNKETRTEHCSLDWKNSTFIQNTHAKNSTINNHIPKEEAKS